MRVQRATRFNYGDKVLLLKTTTGKDMEGTHIAEIVATVTPPNEPTNYNIKVSGGLIFGVPECHLAPLEVEEEAE